MFNKSSIDHVNYDVLDRAKNAFIAASQSTARFAERYGFIPPSGFGASANIFSLDLKPFLKQKNSQLYITLLPEGLGTSDDARPDDLSEKQLERFWHHIGIKTVAVMTNDAASTGMQTVLISLYLPSGTPELVFNPVFMKGFLKGFVEGCKTVGCVYFSGETPQLKNKIYPGKLDIAGALFGLMPAGASPIDGTTLAAGDKIVFIESSGPHDNGFTSLRQLAERLPKGYHTELPGGREYWEAILSPTILYTPFIQDLLRAGLHPSNVEPITGHGWQKLMRSRKPFRYVIHDTLPVPEVFQFIQKEAALTTEQMIKIFNYGVGLAVFIKGDAEATRVVQIARKNGLKAVVAGEVEVSKAREVVVEPWKIILSGEWFALKQ
ncbi:phosphoribosylformylglycinamidine cyclo-ligase [Candidatus Peregrinibacteria bacterium]|nr:phosphoribosylformylglycinamidine cyclo-ligase [Candidatus Peregrinibacteria bacterium]